MLGKPGSTKPLFCMNVAGPWTFDLETSEWMKAMSIDAGGQCGHQITHPFAALAVLFPLPGALHAGPGRALEQFDLFAGVPGLAVAFDEFGLVIEQVALAGGAGHEELHDSLSFGRVVQAAVELGKARGGPGVGEKSVFAQ